MTSLGAPIGPVKCRGCGAPVLLAVLAGTTRWDRFEPADLEPFTQAAIGALILVGRTAWQPDDLIEHFLTRTESTLTAARDLAAGYPAHRRHYHPKENHTNG